MRSKNISIIFLILMLIILSIIGNYRTYVITKSHPNLTYFEILTMIGR
jgi:hypothetical protein